LAAAHRQENLSCKGRPPVALGWFSLVQLSWFCGQVPLEKSSQESWAYCGVAEDFPRRLGLGWLINPESLLLVNVR